MRINFLLLMLLFSQQLFSQYGNYFPLQRDLNNEIENSLHLSSFHSSFKPYLLKNTYSIYNPTDSIIDIEIYSTPSYNNLFMPQSKDLNQNAEVHKTATGKFIWDLLNGHAINVQEDILNLTIDPAINFSGGFDTEFGDATFNNTRGLVINGQMGSKLSFQTSYYENQARFAHYAGVFVADTLVVPGMAKVKKFKGNYGFDYSMATAYVSYSPSKYFNIQFGHDKNFIGDGYRSVLLSDNAARYPFLKLTTNVGRFQYTNMWTEFLDLHGDHPLGYGYNKKYGAFHYLSTIIGKKTELGLFECVIWQSGDDSTHRGFDINYLNPIIFFHSVQYSLGSPDNSMLGANLKIDVTRNVKFYGQFLLDDFDLGRSKSQKGFYRNKYAFQSGVKWFNVLGVPHLFFQTEFNQVWPYTYAHKVVMQNYTHYNQSLAHPLGANFRESVSFLSYRYKRFFTEYEFQFAKVGIDSSANSYVGHNLFSSDYLIPNFPDSYGNFVGQGLLTTIQFHQLRFDFLINPNNNLNIELMLIHRVSSNALQTETTNFVSLGIKTNLFNQYFDF